MWRKVFIVSLLAVIIYIVLYPGGVKFDPGYDRTVHSTAPPTKEFKTVGVEFSVPDINKTEKLKGKKVLVTGASTGIGEQLAYRYAELGANIVITARRENRLKEVVAKCRRIASSDVVIEYVTADMSDIHGIPRVVEEAEQKLGGLDILVLNHVQYFLASFKGTRENLTLFDRMLDVNFRSFVHLTSYALPHLKSTNGSVVVLSSIAGQLSSPFNAIYVSNKFAIEGFYHSLHQEFLVESTGISVTICTLGVIGTENVFKLLEEFGATSHAKNFPPADPSETAAAIVEAGEGRITNLYYPSYWKYVCLLWHTFPKLMEWNNVRRFKAMFHPDE